MDDGLIEGEGTTFGEDFWGPVWALLDSAWPEMSARVAVAESLGAPWAACTHPFVWFEGGRALAHVGVLRHPIRLGGEDRVVAGVHAVCSHPEARGRGLVRRCAEAATAWIDLHFDAAKLHTDYPALYEKFGFRTEPMYEFRSARPGGGGGARRLRPTQRAEDRQALVEALRRREPVSDVHASLDPGWLVLTDAALLRRTDDLFWLTPSGAVLAGEVVEGELRLHDVFGPVPPLEELLAAVPDRFDRVRWSFSPDRLDPEAIPSPTPASYGVLQVRGRWNPSGPVAVSPLWEH